MRRRGTAIDKGARLEFVVLTGPGHRAKKYEKIESADYYAKHTQSLSLDYLYYLQQMVNPIDQVLNAIYLDKDKGERYRFRRDFVLEQYRYRWKIRSAVINELKKLFRPKLRFQHV